MPAEGGVSDAAAPGDGKLERIEEADTKPTTNGIAPHTDTAEDKEKDKDEATEKDKEQQQQVSDNSAFHLALGLAHTFRRMRNSPGDARIDNVDRPPPVLVLESS